MIVNGSSQNASKTYNPPNQSFLVYDNNVPEHLLHPADNQTGKWTVDEHFALANHQLLQLRAAYAAALATNRILIMPELVCAMDRW